MGADPRAGRGAGAFHHPRDVRSRQGRDSPQGFVEDSYDVPALRRELLDPLGPAGDGRYRTAVHDVGREMPVRMPLRTAEDDAVLVLDGIFLHRAELRDCWDLSVFLDVPFEVSVSRCAARDGSDPDPGAAANHRYVEGQRHYLASVRPLQAATFVVDNRDLRRPVLGATGS